MLLLAVAIAVPVWVELAAFGVWHYGFSDRTKDNIRSLTGQTNLPAKVIPNTFWHHHRNRADPSAELNSKGTKGTDFELPKPKGELRIICLGDSTVEGIHLRPEGTFPQQLERMLGPFVEKSTKYRSVKVINAGIGSHNSAFNLAYLSFRLIHYEPDIILLKSSYNDYLPYVIPGMKYDYTHAFPTPFHSLLSHNPFWFFARHSYFLKAVGKFLFPEDVAVPFKSFSGALIRAQFQQMDYSSNKDKFSIFAENIRSMILLSKGREMKIFVLDLPTSPNNSHYGKDKAFGSRFRALIMRLEKELVRVTSEEKVPFINTGPLGKEDFLDHCHNTPKGNLKIATKVFQTLEKEL